MSMCVMTRNIQGHGDPRMHALRPLNRGHDDLAQHMSFFRALVTPIGSRDFGVVVTPTSGLPLQVIVTQVSTLGVGRNTAKNVAYETPNCDSPKVVDVFSLRLESGPGLGGQMICVATAPAHALKMWT